MGVALTAQGELVVATMLEFGQQGSAFGGVSAGEIAALKAEQTRLAAEVDVLKALVHRLARELGVEPE